VRNKHRITQELINLIPEAQRISFDSAMSTWWFNLRKNGGLRLTAAGYVVFADVLKLEHYNHVINDPMAFNQQVILKLDRKMQMPYYIHAVKGVPKQIILFGSREAMMINLYGNLIQFLDNYLP
jgi:hypothetical protein